MSYSGSNNGGGLWGAQGQTEDYTANDREVSAADLEIGEGAAFAADANEVEKAAEDRDYKQIEKPGQYRLQVVNFGKPKKELKDVFVVENGKIVPSRFEAYSVTVYMGDVNDLRYQIGDVFILPPSDPNDLRRYNHGSTKPDMSTAGFHAEKCGHFLNRLIGGFGKGQPLPPAARKLANWIGRQVDAEVVVQKSRTIDVQDKTTGQMVKKTFDVRAQVKLYSYRACGTANGPAGMQPPSQGGAGSPPQGVTHLEGFREVASQPATQSPVRPTPPGLMNI